jgi:ABC-type uncharacterized transport system substrate-binding protein
MLPPMLRNIGRLWLGLGLIAAASLLLLLSDKSNSSKPVAGERPPQLLQVAVVQHASQPILEEGVAGMIDGLAENGFHDSKNIKITRYNAEGDMPAAVAIAKEITTGKFDLILTATTPSLQTVANTNLEGNTPHIFGLVTNPYVLGVGISNETPFSHPSHLAGYGTMQPVADSFRMARKLFPGLKKVGVAWNPAEANSEANTKAARAVCQELGIELIEANVDNTAAISEATGSLIARGAQALWVGGDVTVLVGINSVITSAKKARIPVFTVIPPNAEKGALFDLGADYHEVGRLVGEMAAKVLAGTRPAKLPVENVLPRELVLNPKALEGLRDPWKIPDDVRKSAQRIIGEAPKPQAPVATKDPITRTWKIEMITNVDTPAVEEAIEGLRRGFKEEGAVEGKDYVLTVRSAQGDAANLISMVDNAVTQKADMIIPFTTPALQGCLKRARGIPIVFGVVASAEAAGVYGPDGRKLPTVTGNTLCAPFPQMIAVLKKYYPQYKRLGTVYAPAETNSVFYRDLFDKLCKENGLELVAVPANGPSEVADAALALVSKDVDLICQISDGLSSTAFASVAQAATRGKIPLFTFNTSQVKQGSVLSYARDFETSGHEAAEMAVKVMRGAKPADMPVVEVSKIVLAINLKEAARFKVVIPPELEAKADRVIR